MALGAAIRGMPHLRRWACLRSRACNTSHLGVLYTCSSRDAAGSEFLLAFAHHSGPESPDTWRWFVENCSVHLPVLASMQSLGVAGATEEEAATSAPAQYVIVSTHRNGAREAVLELLPAATHLLCTDELSADVLERFDASAHDGFKFVVAASTAARYAEAVSILQQRTTLGNEVSTTGSVGTHSHYHQQALPRAHALLPR